MRKGELARRVEEQERATAAALARAVAAETDAAMLRTAFDALRLGVVVADATGRVALRNRVATTALGGRLADTLLAAAVEEVLRAASAGDALTREVEIHGPPQRTLVLTARPLSGAGGRLGAVCVVEDVTEIRRLEAVRRDFVGNVSHELRTPVGAVGLLADSLAEEIDPEVMRRLAGRIGEETERVGRIIEDLLDLSAIEAEGAKAPEPLSVKELVEAAVERTHTAAEQFGVEIRVAPVPAGLVVRGDWGQLVSALANLLDNAVKYSDAGSAVDLDAAASGDVVEVAVRDRGVGIPARDVPRIFERFYRVDRARSRKTGGTGLGLAIVRHVAENHGGEIAVDSREGEGSTFTLRLPTEVG